MQAALLDYFYASLKDELSLLETKRLEAYARVKNSRVYWAIGAGFFFLIFVNTLFKEEHLGALFFALALGGMGYGIQWRYSTRAFREFFKEQVVGRMVRHLGLSYGAKEHIKPHLFRQAQLFTREYDTFSGDDLVTGIIRGVRVAWSDVKVTYTTKSSKGKSTRHTLFEGIFFVAPFPKPFRGKTWALPDVAQKVLGDFGTLLQGFDSRGGLVKMDSPDFERAFVVLSKDQIEARYLLSPVLMERLLVLKNRANVPLHVSFVEGHIFLGFAYGKPSFEPTLSASVLAVKTLKNHIQMLALAYDVVEILGLDAKRGSPQEAGED